MLRYIEYRQRYDQRLQSLTMELSTLFETLHLDPVFETLKAESTSAMHISERCLELLKEVLLSEQENYIYELQKEVADLRSRAVEASSDMALVQDLEKSLQIYSSEIESLSESLKEKDALQQSLGDVSRENKQLRQQWSKLFRLLEQQQRRHRKIPPAETSDGDDRSDAEESDTALPAAGSSGDIVVDFAATISRQLSLAESAEQRRLGLEVEMQQMQNSLATIEEELQARRSQSAVVLERMDAALLDLENVVMFSGGTPDATVTNGLAVLLDHLFSSEGIFQSLVGLMNGTNARIMASFQERLSGISVRFSDSATKDRTWLSRQAGQRRDMKERLRLLEAESQQLLDENKRLSAKVGKYRERYMAEKERVAQMGLGMSMATGLDPRLSLSWQQQQAQIASASSAVHGSGLLRAPIPVETSGASVQTDPLPPVAPIIDESEISRRLALVQQQHATELTAQKDIYTLEVQRLSQQNLQLQTDLSSARSSLHRFEMQHQEVSAAVASARQALSESHEEAARLGLLVQEKNQEISRLSRMQSESLSAASDQQKKERSEALLVRQDLEARLQQWKQSSESSASAARNLKDQLEMQMKDNFKLRQQRSQSQKKLAALQDAVLRLRSDLSQCRSSCSVFLRESSPLRHLALQIAERYRMDVRERERICQEQVVRVEQALSEKQAYVESLVSSELPSLRREVSASSSRVSSLVSLLSVLVEVFPSLQKFEGPLLSEKAEEHGKALAGMREAMALEVQQYGQSVVADLRARFDSLTAEIRGPDGLLKRLGDAQAEIAKLAGERDALKNKLEFAADNSRKDSLLMRDLRRVLNEKEAQIGNLQKERLTLQAGLAEREKQVADVKVELGNLRSDSAISKLDEEKKMQVEKLSSRLDKLNWQQQQQHSASSRNVLSQSARPVLVRKGNSTGDLFASPK